MKKLGVLAATLSTFLSASAYDFEADGIYYNITDPTAKEVEVTYGSYGEYYSGDIVVPSSVAYNDVKYSVTAIGDMAFSECDDLTTITIPNSVTTIGSSAFYDCDGLTSITLPNSVTDIGKETFYGCSSLTRIDVDVDNQTYSSNDGILYDKSQTTLICCPEGKSGEVIIPNSVTAIGEEAFFGCSSLTSITLPNSVTAIGKESFAYCNSLVSITIPNSVTTIGYEAFWYCTGLTSITIPDSVTTIGAEAFGGCSSLTSITIPNSVTTIKGGAFAGCSSLTSITIPNSVTTIEDSVFEGCSSLTSITIPNSVTTIAEEAFYGCSSLTSITSLAVMPPACEELAFEGIDKQKCTLYVPTESVEAYKQANGWKDFVLVEEVEAGIDSVAAGSVDGATEVFNPTGAKVADSLENLPAGIYLVREGSTIRKIAVR